MEMKLNKILQKTYQEKTGKNKLYSLRAFARDIGIGKSTLHEILNSEKRVTKSTALKILQYLEVPAKDFDTILNFNINPESDLVFKKLTPDEFQRIATCEHYALLSLCQLPNCPSAPEQLSQQLKLSKDQTIQIVESLFGLELIYKENNYLKRSSRLLTTTYDVPNKIIQNYHASNLERIKNSLSEIEVEFRDIASSTFLMSPKKMEELKNDLKALRRKLVSNYEDKAKDSEAYLLNFSVIPISRRSLNAQ